MPRQVWVYPRDGGDPIPKEQYHATSVSSGQVILPDLPDFVSPIDGKLYCGRTGLRDHNRRHDVVCNEDLKGLPPLSMTSDTRSSSERCQDAAKRKQQIINLVNQHYR